MLSAKDQTHYDNAKLLVQTIRQTKHFGQHDGLGNPVVSVPLYYQWAQEACDAVEWLLSEVAPAAAKEDG